MERLKQLIQNLWVLWDWITSFFKFLANWIITLLNSLWNLFLSIFNWDLFDLINDVFVVLSSYLGSVWAFLFISLFVLVFSIMIISFLFRLLRGRVNYDATLRRKEFYDKHPLKK